MRVRKAMFQNTSRMPMNCRNLEARIDAHELYKEYPFQNESLICFHDYVYAIIKCMNNLYSSHYPSLLSLCDYHTYIYILNNQVTKYNKSSDHLFVCFIIYRISCIF